MLGQYRSKSYHYSLRLAHSYLQMKLHDDLKPTIEELKAVNELGLSASKVKEENDDELKIVFVHVTCISFYLFCSSLRYIRRCRSCILFLTNSSSVL